jgi:hypothetical protein
VCFGSAVFGANQDLPPELLKKQNYTEIDPARIESRYQFSLFMHPAQWP